MTSRIIIKNRLAQAVIHPLRGALITDLRLEDQRGEPVDILWQSPQIHEDTSGWPMGGIPFLFPFAGRVYHEDQPLSYKWESTVYPMPLHGFAYGLPWTGVASANSGKATTDKASFILEDSEATHLLYPFKFRVQLDYSLTPSSLNIEAKITSKGALGNELKPHTDQGSTGSLMPVAPGFHPFFNVPLRGNSRVKECFLETTSLTRLRVTPKGLAGKAHEGPQNPVPLSDPDYQNAILTDLQKPLAMIVDRDNRLGVEVGWDEPSSFKHLVLWSNQIQEFFCLEPWTALPDALAPGHGALLLKNNESINLAFHIKLKDLRR